MITNLEIVIFIENGMCLNQKHLDKFMRSCTHLVDRIEYNKINEIIKSIKIIMLPECIDCEDIVKNAEIFFKNYSPKSSRNIGINHIAEFDDKAVKLESITVYEASVKIDCLTTRLY